MRMYCLRILYCGSSPVSSVQPSVWLLFLQKFTDIWTWDPPAVVTGLSIHVQYEMMTPLHSLRVSYVH